MVSRSDGVEKLSVMSASGVTKPDDELVGFFMRHIVPVFFTFEKQDEPPKNMMMTAFVLSVGEAWFLVTAGHCIGDVRRITTEHGYRIDACYLIDSLGLDAKYRQPIPFSYAKSHPTRLSESKSFDYGVMVLSAYYRDLLQKNNVQALSEAVWKCEPSDPHLYLLVGIPQELVEVKPEHLEVVPILLPVGRVDERPAGFSETELPRLYGRIRLEGEIASIEGMSGGPILAFQHDAEGQLRYWLVALQSTWVSKSQSIAACPTRILGEVLEEFLVSLEHPEHL